MIDLQDGQIIQPIIIGAGPAGLTAAREFLKHGVTSFVLESDKVVGGISRTVQQNGWRFDIGGHRFFLQKFRVLRKSGMKYFLTPILCSDLE